MAYSERPYASGYSNFTFFPVAVKWLLIVNIGLFVLYYLSVLGGFHELFAPFGLVPADAAGRLWIWQLVTYMFLHDPLGFQHILFNMLTLWMFGADLERSWGTREFLKYYFLCGVGAGVCVVIANLLFSDNLHSRTIGASGAIYGLLLAFGMLWPDRQVLFSFLFPIKAKYFVMIMGGIAFLSSLGTGGGNVSHVAHLGGMLFGYGYLKRRVLRRPRRRTGPGYLESARFWYRDYKLRRAKRKFEVYLRKRQSDQDPFLH